jgi:hypothetical protein
MLAVITHKFNETQVDLDDENIKHKVECVCN